MPPHFHFSRRLSSGSHWRRTCLFLIAALCLLLPCSLDAVELGWSRTGKEMIFGELTEFDFDKKTVTIKDGKTGKKTTFSSSQLNIRSQWSLIFTSAFHDSIPEEGSGSEHLIFAFYFILIPIALYMSVFWICAMSLLGKINPLRAVIAITGAGLLSGFLIAFYLFMIGRHPDNATPICILGAIVTMTSASLFVAIIYHKKLVHGFTLILTSSIVTPILYASAIYIPYKIGEPEKITTLFENRLLIPIGILHGKKK